MLQNQSKRRVEGAFSIIRESGFFSWADHQIRLTFGLPPSLISRKIWKSHAHFVSGDDLWRLYKSVRRLQGVRQPHPEDLIDRFHVLTKTFQGRNRAHNLHRLVGACNRVLLYKDEVPQDQVKQICNIVTRRFEDLGPEQLLQAIKFRIERHLFLENVFGGFFFMLLRSNNAVQFRPAASRTRFEDMSIPEDTTVRLQNQYGIPILLIRNEVGDERKKRVLDSFWKLLAMRDEAILEESLSGMELQAFMTLFTRMNVRPNVMYMFLQKQHPSVRTESQVILPLLRQCQKYSRFDLAFKICQENFESEQIICLDPTVPIDVKVSLSHQAVTVYRIVLKSLIARKKQRKILDEIDSKRACLQEITRMVSVDKRFRFGTTNQAVMKILQKQFVQVARHIRLSSLYL